MGFKFRKSKKIAPGVRVNFNKKSSSVTFGSKGLHHTISSTGKKLLVLVFLEVDYIILLPVAVEVVLKIQIIHLLILHQMIEIIILQIRIGIMVIKILSNIYFIAQLLLQSF